MPRNLLKVRSVPELFALKYHLISHSVYINPSAIPSPLSTIKDSSGSRMLSNPSLEYARETREPHSGFYRLLLLFFGLLTFSTIAHAATYTITVSTSNVEDAETDNGAGITLFGSEGTTPEINLGNGPFRRGRTDVFRVDAPDIGPRLFGIRLEVPASAPLDDWRVDRVCVRNEDRPVDYGCLTINRWLSKRASQRGDENNRETCVTVDIFAPLPCSFNRTPAPGGTVVALDANGGTLGKGALFRISTSLPRTRELISDFGNNLEGEPGSEPVSIALRFPPPPGPDAPAGQIYVLDQNTRLLFKLDPAATIQPPGNRFVRSIEADLRDPLVVTPTDFAFEASGDIVLTDADAGSEPEGEGDRLGALLRLTPSFFLGHRVYDISVLTTDNIGRNPSGVAIATSPLISPSSKSILPGDILVADVGETDGFTGGAIYVRDPSGAFRATAGGFPGGPVHLAVEPIGTVLVTLASNGPNRLYRMRNPEPQGEVLSDFSNRMQDPPGYQPTAKGGADYVATDALGHILVTDSSNNVLLSVEPVNGRRHLVSDFNDAAQGAIGRKLTGVAISTFDIKPPSPGDLNGDGLVDCADLKIVADSLGKRAGDPSFNPMADVVVDGVIDVLDLAALSQLLPAGTACQQ